METVLEDPHNRWVSLRWDVPPVDVGWRRCIMAGLQAEISSVADLRRCSVQDGNA